MNTQNILDKENDIGIDFHKYKSLANWLSMGIWEDLSKAESLDSSMIGIMFDISKELELNELEVFGGTPFDFNGAITSLKYEYHSITSKLYPNDGCIDLTFEEPDDYYAHINEIFELGKALTRIIERFLDLPEFQSACSEINPNGLLVMKQYSVY